MEKKTTKVGKTENRLYELLNICNDTKQPNPKAREELQELINSDSTCTELIRKQEGLYTIALRTRMESMNTSDTLKEVLYVKCKHLREDLGYSYASKLEKLAIEQIVLCWLNHHQMEMLHANKLSQSHNTESGIY